LEKVVIGGHHHDIDITDEIEYGTFSSHRYSRVTVETVNEKEEKTSFVSYILTIVLSVHSFISGLALGVESNTTSLIALTVAIVSHKWVESFAVGVSLVRMGVPFKKFFLIMLAYSSMTPVGVFTGMGIYKALQGDGITLFSGIVGAVSAGTFIYVAVVDILVEEFTLTQRKVLRFLKLVACLIGFGLMASLLIIHEHEHDHDHDHDH